MYKSSFHPKSAVNSTPYCILKCLMQDLGRWGIEGDITKQQQWQQRQKAKVHIGSDWTQGRNYKWDIGNQNWSQEAIWQHELLVPLLPQHGRGQRCLLRMGGVGAGGLGSEWVKGQIFLKFRKTKSSLRTSGFLYWIFSSPTIYFFRVLSLLLSLFCCSIVSYPTEKNTINEFNSPVEPTSWALFTGHQGPIDTNVKKCYLRNLHIWVLQVP